jgi:hypothetical protein
MDAILVPALMFLATARLATGDAAAAAAPLAHALRRARDSGLDVIMIVLVATAVDPLVAIGSVPDAAVVLGALDAEAFGPLTPHVVGHVDTFEDTAALIRAALPPGELADATERGAAMDGRATVAFVLEALSN